MSPTGTPLWDVLGRVVDAHYPGAKLLPRLIVGFTDAPYFREHGRDRLRLRPVLAHADRRGDGRPLPRQRRAHRRGVAGPHHPGLAGDVRAVPGVGTRSPSTPDDPTARSRSRRRRPSRGTLAACGGRDEGQRPEAGGDQAVTPAAEHDVPIPYMQRTRDYYQALGLRAVPVGALRRRAVHAAGQAARSVACGPDHDGGALPARPRRPGPGGQVQRRRPSSTRSTPTRQRAPPTCASRTLATTAPTPPPRISGRGCRWRALQAAVKTGRIGALTPRFHGAPTNRSQRVTIETDAPELLRRCREDGAEVAVLVPS